ncbi:histone-lysine N-methyltransferase SETMAR-like [Harpegnathos saltator]|uniref:histone-lysine N-methyltransferase SETMAR-like n=1 Tax=Harpegnathos saltator TaxID=610380 RepID=UPI000DBEE103|nr:histone-lysine N-methyltransferase SETMAR-like [Harpegnathos saltator]
MRMSPKVNSSRLYGSFKMSQIQQKLFAHEALRSKWSPVFFGKTGYVATVPLVQCRTVNSEWYTTICLSEIFGKIRETNRRRRIILHQDNASSHTSAQTRDFLRTEKVELMGYPPYSPDLAPNDFFLFPQIKNKLRGQHFSTPEEAVDAFKMHVLEVPQSEWKKCFENWFKRMQKCIDLHGEYFEKQ